MKKLYSRLAFAILVAASLGACSDKDADDPNSEDTI